MRRDRKPQPAPNEMSATVSSKLIRRLPGEAIALITMPSNGAVMAVITGVFGSVCGPPNRRNRVLRPDVMPSSARAFSSNAWYSARLCS